MATSIFFNGSRVVVPQVVSKVDTTGLDAVGPSAVGIVALLGEAEGGEPLTCAVGNDLTNPQGVQDQYRSGDLRTAALFAFNPSQDDAIPGGAQRVIPIKVNPATRSALTLVDALGADAVDLLSRDYGQFTEQISIDIEAGTVQGKKITVVFEDSTETFDDVGGDTALTVVYTPGADGYDTATGAISAAGFDVTATKAEAGLDSELTATAPALFPGPVSVVSDDAADTTQSITIYGVDDASGNAARETLALTGTTPVVGSTSWAKVLGYTLDSAAAGTVTVSDGTNTIGTVATGVVARGVVLPTNAPAAGVATISTDDDIPSATLIVFGESAAGAPIQEAFDLTTANTTPVTGTTSFGLITGIALGEVPAARTATLSITAVSASASVFRTVQRLADRLSAITGFVGTALLSDAATRLVTELDYVSGTSVHTTAGNFLADLDAVIDTLNASSSLVSATRATGGSQVPANLAAPTFLSGGSEGTTTITQWQAAFDLLRKRRANIIVPLTRDPAVHALLLQHLIWRAGAGQSEANGYVGLATSAGAGETLANIRSQAQVLNTRHISVIAEEVSRFDPLTGEATWFPPYFLGAIAAGMQAGSPIGEPLTRKIINALDTRNDSSWSRENDAETLIDSGLMFTEQVDGIGIRWVRSITSYLQKPNNLVFTEVSANESANQAVFEFRRQLDQKIGDRGLASSVGTIKGLAIDVLQRLVTDEVIAAFRPETLTVEQAGDVFPVSVEIAPVTPINFIPAVVHLVPQTASA